MIKYLLNEIVDSYFGIIIQYTEGMGQVFLMYICGFL